MQQIKVHRIGDPSSKYGYNLGQLDKDIKQHKFESDLFKSKVRNLILEDPSKMDIRYHQVVEVLRDIKSEFGL